MIIEIKREKKIIGSSLEALVELKVSRKIKDYINEKSFGRLKTDFQGLGGLY